jgi:hypothetical protein
VPGDAAAAGRRRDAGDAGGFPESNLSGYFAIADGGTILGRAVRTIAAETEE